ncbi:phage portal protein [Xanthomonas campestris pv. trichodesmae]|uniref:Phage portal protein n=1 Tax=Xanthomonas citri pv. vignicola TaxID=473426 RepID=A0AB33CF77_XANCI|nr:MULTISPECIES: phage portal protein [Xanthomonas]ASK92634.1 phage portal protein [Xanthomonas citri pv. vignicola]MBV6687350.1 phage portal protein [Xanthomonas euvesicatoria pv. physalidis]MBV6782080.1 phage portal protein [Xanthomonas campestris pv. trichodesmae]
MTGFSPRELATEAGVRNYGVGYLKSLSPVAGSGRDGWMPVVREPFMGAWQRNMEERHESVMTYPTLYACMNRINSDIGKLPFVLKVEGADGIWRIDTANTAFWPVLRKPNAYQTAQQFREAWILSKLSQGNTYVLKGRDERNVVTRLWVLDPNRVQPMVSDSGDVFYQVNYGSGDNLLPEKYPGDQLVIPASEIIHDRMNCFHHQLIGVPPLCAANWAAVKNLKILKDSTTFFSNGANPGGILTAPAGMSEDDAQAVKEYWSTSFQGSNAGKVAVIGADMKFTPFAFKAADSQLVEQMRYSDEQVCQPFGIPPFKIGIGSIPAGMKVDDVNQLYYSDALQAHIESMETLLDEGLGISRPRGVECDLEPLLRMDVGKQADVHTKLTGGGIEAPNEARRAFGLPPLEGGDTVYMQQQDYPLDQVRLNKIEPPAAPAAEELLPVQDDEPDDSEELRALVQENFMLRALVVARAEVFRND